MDTPSEEYPLSSPEGITIYWETQRKYLLAEPEATRQPFHDLSIIAVTVTLEFLAENAALREEVAALKANRWAGSFSDGEVALILVRRDVFRRELEGGVILPLLAFEDEGRLVEGAKRLGLWPPEVGKDA